MSTKALREALKYAPDGLQEAAAAEVERIETTAKTLSIHYTATIRAEGMPNAADLLERIAKEAP